MSELGLWSPEVGQRMEAFARAAGLSAVVIAERLRLASPSTVHKWWRGVREPSASNMYAYAQLVGRDVSEMYGEEIAPRLLSLFRGIADRVMAGHPMGRAMEQASGVSLHPEAKARLDLLSPQYRTYLQEQAGRDWDALSDIEKNDILLEVARLARGRDQGSLGGSAPTRKAPGAKGQSGPSNNLQ